jgi:hypothetical protein
MYFCSATIFWNFFAPAYLTADGTSRRISLRTVVPVNPIQNLIFMSNLSDSVLCLNFLQSVNSVVRHLGTQGDTANDLHCDTQRSLFCDERLSTGASGRRIGPLAIVARGLQGNAERATVRPTWNQAAFH